LMMQQEKASDLVIATGRQYSVRQFAEEAASVMGFEIEWTGSGINEVGKDKRSGKTLIDIDPRYFRPSEVQSLLGDASKAREFLGWTPKISFHQLVAEMSESDLAWARKNQ